MPHLRAGHSGYGVFGDNLTMPGSLYHLLLLPKFVGVMMFGAGIGGAFLADSLVARKKSVHRVASSGLLLIWLFGFAALEVAHVPQTELWIVASIILSFVSQGGLVATVSGKQHRGPKHLMAVAIPLLLTLYFMIAKPTWQMVRQ